MKNFNYVSKHTGDIYNLGLSVGKYANGQTSIQLIDIDDGFPYAVATVAVDCELKENEVAIKNYSENEGVLKNLVNNDIIEKPHRFTSSGFVTIPICFIKNLE